MDSPAATADLNPAPDQQAEAVQRPKRRGGKFILIIAILLSPILLVLLQVGFLFLFVALLPSIVAYIIDIDYSRRQFKSVLAMNFAGITPYFVQIFSSGSSKAMVQIMMGDPKTWLVIYSWAAGAWVVMWVARLVTYAYVKIRYQTKIAILERAQKSMEEEWGAHIKLKEEEEK